MTAVDRILLVLMFVALFVKSILMLAAGLSVWDPRPWLAGLGQSMAETYPAQTAIIGLVELLVATYFLTWAFRRRHASRAIVQESELGTVRISLKAVESLVQRAARQAQGVRDVRVDVRSDKQGVFINLTITVAPDVSIPAVSDEVQRRVEQYITQTVGVTVARVTVTFRAVAEVGKSRVE